MSTRIFVIAVAIFFLGACAEPQTSEQQIRNLLGEMAEAAADEKLRPLKAALSESYSDARGNDKKAIVAMMRLYMLRADNVLVFLDIDEINVQTQDYASASVSVRFTGANLAALSLRTSKYQFELDLTQEEGDWRILSARWGQGRRELR